MPTLLTRTANNYMRQTQADQKHVISEPPRLYRSNRPKTIPPFRPSTQIIQKNYQNKDNGTKSPHRRKKQTKKEQKGDNEIDLTWKSHLFMMMTVTLGPHHWRMASTAPSMLLSCIQVPLLIPHCRPPQPQLPPPKNRIKKRTDRGDWRPLRGWPRGDVKCSRLNYFGETLLPSISEGERRGRQTLGVKEVNNNKKRDTAIAGVLLVRSERLLLKPDFTDSSWATLSPTRHVSPAECTCLLIEVTNGPLGTHTELNLLIQYFCLIFFFHFVLFLFFDRELMIPLLMINIQFSYENIYIYIYMKILKFWRDVYVIFGETNMLFKHF